MSEPRSALLGAYLYKLRESHNYSQDHVAYYMGMSRQCIGHYEKGIRTPNIDTLYRFSHLYDVPLEDLLCLLPPLGNSGMYSDLSVAAAVSDEGSLLYLSKMESQLLRQMRALPDDKKNRLLQYADRLASTQKE